MIWSAVVNPLLNPAWCFGSSFSLSRYHFRRAFSIISIALARQDVREIGRYESGLSAGLFCFKSQNRND